MEGGPDAGPMASPTQARQELPQRTRPRQTRDAKGPHGRGRPSRAHSEEARSVRPGTDTNKATRGSMHRDVGEPGPKTKEVGEPMPRSCNRPITRLKDQSHHNHNARFPQKLAPRSQHTITTKQRGSPQAASAGPGIAGPAPAMARAPWAREDKEPAKIPRQHAWTLEVPRRVCPPGNHLPQ